MHEVEERAQALLVQAGVERQFPTPIDPIAAALGLREEPCPPIEFIDAYSSRLPITEAGSLQSALKKTVGWKQGQDYGIHSWFASKRQIRRAAFHEMAHQALPCHHIPAGRELLPKGHLAFDEEADAFADELIFQGSHFDSLAGGLPLTTASVTRLADLYEASWHDTLIRFVERRMEPVILSVNDGAEPQIVAAASPALELGLDQSHIADATLIQAFDIGLRIVGVRRYELLVVAGRRNLRLVA